jgi:hypothetical protein
MGIMIIILGVPYSVSKLTQSDSPYGHSRIVGPIADRPIEEIYSKVPIALGKRVSKIANRITVWKRGKEQTFFLRYQINIE